MNTVILSGFIHNLQVTSPTPSNGYQKPGATFSLAYSVPVTHQGAESAPSGASPTTSTASYNKHVTYQSAFINASTFNPVIINKIKTGVIKSKSLVVVNGRLRGYKSTASERFVNPLLIDQIQLLAYDPKKSSHLQDESSSGSNPTPDDGVTQF